MSAKLGTFARTLIEVGRWRLAWTLGLIVLLPLTEGLGVALLLPTLEATGMKLDDQGAAGHYARLIDRGFAALGIHPALMTLLALYVGVFAARSILNRNRSVSAWLVQQKLEDTLRRRLYSAIARANWLFIVRSRFSDFTHALTAELGRVTDAAATAILLAAELASAVLYLALALALSWPMTVMVTIAGALLAMALRGRTRRLETQGIELSAHTNRLFAAASEHLSNLKTAKTYGAEERDYEIFAAISRNIAATRVASATELVAAGTWFEIGGALLLIPILYTAIHVLGLPSAELLILLALFWRLMPRFQMSHHYYRDVVYYLPSFANVMALEQRCLAASEPQPALNRAPAFAREVRLEDVAFAYRPESGATVHGVALAIRAGQITAIVGPSGVGKSTVADLVMGLMEPSSGRITLDGVTLEANNTRGWRERIGYVAQETPLFHLSVRENLLWARPGALEAEMWRALELAAAAEFVRGLPAGIDTVVGDRGLILSQGERQRVALARALLRRPALLILDEATNSLDYDNESKVLGAIEALRGELTVLIIAHRLSAIRWADMIYVMEDGTIVESGGWEELNARREGRFRALCDAQRLVA